MLLLVMLEMASHTFRSGLNVSKNSITIKTPGKLMIAGEFAVLEPNHHLITMAVNRFVYVTAKDSISNILNLTDFGLNNIQWKYDGKAIIVDCSDDRISFVKEALFITYTYLAEIGISPDYCEVSVTSELADESGIKYGLGSSAAVVTAVVTAVLTKNLKTKIDKDLIFKLAALAHINVQGNGSGADIAASTYGGMVLYSSFQANWLISEYEQCESISSLIKKDWTYLSIKHLKWPKQFYMRIGWTGYPASTGSLVHHILKLKVSHPEQYNAFLKQSEQAVKHLSQGIETHNFTLLLNGISKNRKALARIGKLAGVEIETEKLHLLSQLAEKYEGAGKLSGAGGGDCGIAFVPTKKLGDELAHTWRQYDIKPLNIMIHSSGTSIK